MDLLDEWVQEALDAIEYANGPVDSTWGSVRAANGHPEPFNVRLVGIGNENSGPEYDKRYAVFYKAFKERYPEIETIACADVKSAPIDIIDHHYYVVPDWFMAHSDLYDDADRQGPKIFVGEYAANQSVGQGNLAAALSEAAFMAGMERNGDIIDMAAYAPLFQHEEDRAWPVNLIVFNNSEVYGLPSYHVQKMFAENSVDRVQPLTIDAPGRAVKALEQGTIGLGTWATRAEFKDIVVTSGDEILYETSADKAPKDWRFLKGGEWQAKPGSIVQDGAPDDPLALALAGAADWTDYSLRLKARKLSGDEGFLIAFRAGDEGNLFWWNLGGWGNASHGLERTVSGSKSRVGHGVTGRIETDRWYDIRIDVTGQRIQCWLDGELIHDVKDEIKPIPTMVAVAGRDEASGQWVVKVVNYSVEARSTKITLENVGEGSFAGEVITLVSGSLLDENTFEQPEKVSAQSQAFGPVEAEFDYEFPPYSLTILRLGQ
jgi:alpha-L-arabinofuranosidase